MTTSLSKLFVGGLSWGTIDSVLFEEFAKYGPLDEAIVVRDKVTGRSRGFGFVRFQDPENAQRAKEATDGNPIDGRVVRVDFASEKRRPAMGMNPYDNPYGGNPLQANFMGAYPAQASYMQSPSQGYGYSQYPQQMMNGMGGMGPMGGMYQQSPMQMHPLQQYQHMQSSRPGNDAHGILGEPAADAIGYPSQGMQQPQQYYQQQPQQQQQQQPSPPAGLSQTAQYSGDEAI